jgi:3-phosphoshikimate 1-carboxyvinyltransferase
VLHISPGRVSGRIVAPASKSDAQRALAAASLARGRSVISGCTSSDDTDAAFGVTAALGAHVEREGDSVSVEGWHRPPSGRADCGESGLALRMFAAIAALHDREITLDGHGTLRSRPIGMIEDALRACGVACRSQDGRLPLVVRGPLRGGPVTVDGSVTSQHITGLLFALPLAAEDTHLVVLRPASRPYLAMTLRTLAGFGIGVEATPDLSAFRLPGRQRYRPTDCRVEGDWSGASCLLVAAAIAGRVEVDNLDVESPQADRAVLDVLQQAGARVTVADRTVAVEQGSPAAFEWDAGDAPDLVPALVALACHCPGTSRITGVSRLRHKESDRASALVEMLHAMGGVAAVDADALVVTGAPLRGGSVETRHDHRIAMAAAVAALRSTSGVTLDDPWCVAKSYPRFFDDLRHVCEESGFGVQDSGFR